MQYYTKDFIDEDGQQNKYTVSLSDYNPSEGDPVDEEMYEVILDDNDVEMAGSNPLPEATADFVYDKVCEMLDDDIDSDKIVDFLYSFWPREVVIELKDGRTVRSSSAEYIAGDYVRICDKFGKELSYWDNKEWEEEPIVVMGAIINCIAQDTQIVLKASNG